MDLNWLLESYLAIQGEQIDRHNICDKRDQRDKNITNSLQDHITKIAPVIPSKNL